MVKAPKTLSTVKKIVSPIREFISDSRAVGIVLICCTIISLATSNSAWADGYIQFWEINFRLPSFLHLPHSITHIINDGLMTVFFLLAGLEIKRALITGELRSVKKSMLPILAAVGGMLLPALFYLLWNRGTDVSKGWGIPIATDIAFSLAILSLLGKRIPLSLKIFLMALAIIDDVGGIVTIAIFYSGKININYLFAGAGIISVLALMNLLKVRQHFLYLLPGIAAWYCIYNSGVHPTISGVLVALTIPLKNVAKLEHVLHDPVNFFIMPLFALANTAIALPGELSFIYNSPVHHGILMGLVLGKPLGITAVSWLAVKIKIAALPEGLNWHSIFGAGMVAGIGFTISIFMATLAFEQQPGTATIAKVAIIGSSVLAGVLGFVYLRVLSTKK